jgi:hypothetical protein
LGTLLSILAVDGCHLRTRWKATLRTLSSRALAINLPPGLSNAKSALTAGPTPYWPGPHLHTLRSGLLKHSMTHIYEYSVKITSSQPLVGYCTKRDTRQLVTIVRWDPQTGERRCDCHRFQDQQFPHAHAAAALVKAGRDVKEAIEAQYLLINLINAYETVLQPFVIDQLEPDVDIFPPPRRNVRGRIGRKRKEKGQNPGIQQSQPQRCGECNEIGHKRQTCPNRVPMGQESIGQRYGRNPRTNPRSSIPSNGWRGVLSSLIGQLADSTRGFIILKAFTWSDLSYS